MKDIEFLSGRLWIKMMLMMGVLPLFATIFDRAAFVQGALGTTNNMSLVFLVAYSFIFAVNLKDLREKGDRAFLLFGLSLGVFIFVRTMIAPANEFIGGAGAVIILFSILSGFAAYAMALRGVDVPRVVVITVLLTALCAPLAPILIAISPDAYEVYYLKVYGYSNIRVLGYFVGVASVAGLLMLPWAVGGSKARWCGFALTALMVISWSLLFWSGSRAAFVSAVAAIIVSWVFISWPGLKLIVLSLATMAGGAALSLLYVEPSHHFGLLSRFHQTAEGLTSGNMTKITTNRSDLWAWAVERIMEAPLLGHGMYPMSHLRTDQFNFFHSHNIILEYGLGVGIPMAAVILGTILVLYVRAGLAARRSDNPFAVTTFGIVTVSAMAAQLNAILFFPFYMMIFLTGIAGLVALHKSQIKR